jgi:hypothetical protein
MTRSMSLSRGLVPAVLALLLALAIGPAHAADPALERLAGYVDASAFAALADEETTKVVVTLPKSLLKLVSAADPELSGLVGGLEMIQAVVLELGEGTPASRLDRLATVLDSTGTSLVGKGWQRLASISEPRGATVQVLMLQSGEEIRGLVVLLVDRHERSAVFANIAGLIDLAGLQRMGEHLDIPGLDAIPSQGDRGKSPQD